MRMQASHSVLKWKDFGCRWLLSHQYAFRPPRFKTLVRMLSMPIKTALPFGSTTTYEMERRHQGYSVIGGCCVYHNRHLEAVRTVHFTPW